MTLQMFTSWATMPTRDGLARLQDTIQARPDYDPYADPTGAVAPLLDAGRFGAARTQLEEAMATHVLSPGVHAMLSRAARGLGDEEAAHLEHELMQLTSGAVFQSGDGSRSRPYLVLHTSVEYDLLEALDFKHVAKASADADGMPLDVFLDADGNELCFLLRNGGRRPQ